MPGPVYSETVAIRARRRRRFWQALVDATQGGRVSSRTAKKGGRTTAGRADWLPGAPDEDMIVGRVEGKCGPRKTKKLEHTFRFGADHAGTQDDPETIVA